MRCVSLNSIALLWCTLLARLCFSVLRSLLRCHRCRCASQALPVPPVVHGMCCLALPSLVVTVLFVAAAHRPCVSVCVLQLEEAQARIAELENELAALRMGSAPVSAAATPSAADDAAL